MTDKWFLFDQNRIYTLSWKDWVVSFWKVRVGDTTSDCCTCRDRWWRGRKASPTSHTHPASHPWFSLFFNIGIIIRTLLFFSLFQNNGRLPVTTSCLPCGCGRERERRIKKKRNLPVATITLLAFEWCSTIYNTPLALAQIKDASVWRQIFDQNCSALGE